jgi:hypothetical protein
MVIGKNLGGTQYFTGYLDEVRITKGLARWTAPFSVPTKQYAEAKETSTKLLLHCNQVTGAPNNYFLDSSLSNHPFWVSSGSPIISAIKAKFGNGALYSGAACEISSPDSSDWDFLGNNFTIDAWVYFTSFTDSPLRLMHRTDDDNRWYYMIRDSGGGVYKQYFAFAIAGTYYVETYSNTALFVNNWYHVAVVRNGSSFTYYLNGVADGSATQALSIGNYTGNLTCSIKNGYVDELRITNSIARWTSGFTPPTAPYPDYQ